MQLCLFNLSFKSKGLNINKIEICAKYAHYKGVFVCEVVGIAKHTETQESLVIYKHINDGIDKLWARPEKMWFDKVELNGQTLTRFKKID